MLAKNKLLSKRLRGFTLLESLLVLFIVASMTMLLSSQLTTVFSQVRQQLFFLEFEHLYKETQQKSQAYGEKMTLLLTETEITNGYQTVAIPADIKGPVKEVTFENNGGNHSLSKLQFVTDSGRVDYQLYLGSGKYQKTRH